MNRNRCDRCESSNITISNNSKSINERTLICQRCGKTGYEVF